MDVFLYQGTIYLCAAVIAVPLAARLGLGSVLGYLAAGIVIGPILIWWAPKPATFNTWPNSAW